MKCRVLGSFFHKFGPLFLGLAGFALALEGRAQAPVGPLFTGNPELIEKTASYLAAARDLTATVDDISKQNGLSAPYQQEKVQAVFESFEAEALIRLMQSPFAQLPLDPGKLGLLVDPIYQNLGLALKELFLELQPKIAQASKKLDEVSGTHGFESDRNFRRALDKISTERGMGFAIAFKKAAGNDGKLKILGDFIGTFKNELGFAKDWVHQSNGSAESYLNFAFTEALYIKLSSEISRIMPSLGPILTKKISNHRLAIVDRFSLFYFEESKIYVEKSFTVSREVFLRSVAERAAQILQPPQPQPGPEPESNSEETAPELSEPKADVPASQSKNEQEEEKLFPLPKSDSSAEPVKTQDGLLHLLLYVPDPNFKKLVEQDLI